MRAGEAALRSFDEAGDVDRAIRAHNYLAVVWWRRGNAVEAMRVGSEALERADAHGGDVERARIRINLAAILELTGDFARGRRVLREALDLAGSRRALRTVILLNSARLDVCEGLLDEAEAHLEVALDGGLDVTHAWHVEAWLLRGVIASRRGLHTRRRQASIAATRSPTRRI